MKKLKNTMDLFQKDLINLLIGEKLASKYDMKKLALLIKRGKLEVFLDATKQEQELGQSRHTEKKERPSCGPIIPA